MAEEEKPATGKDLVVSEKSPLDIDRWLSADELVKETQHLHELMKKVLREDQHYGTIPGTDKPMIYKAGAEKIGLSFRLRPVYKTATIQMPDFHREFQVETELFSIKTGRHIGAGLGSCSTRETKYLYRKADPIPTDRPVPPKFWDLKAKKQYKEAYELLGGKGFTFKKIENRWMICKETGEMVLNSNPADLWNTCLKMAKKRSYVDAIIESTAASDIFMPPPEGTGDEEEEEIIGAGTAAGSAPPAGKTEPPEETPAQRLKKVILEDSQLYDEARLAEGFMPDQHPQEEKDLLRVLDRINKIWKTRNLEKKPLTRLKELAEKHPDVFETAKAKHNLVKVLSEKNAEIILKEMDAILAGQKQP